MRYNTAAIRDLLNQALSDDELNTLVFDHFREIYDNYFTASLTRQQKTQILLEQAERRGETERLLALVRELNPAQVTAFADQVLRVPPAAAPKGRQRLLIGLGGLIALALVGWGGRALWLSLGPPLTPLPTFATCQASREPVRVALQSLAECPDETSVQVQTALVSAGAVITQTSANILRTWRQPEGFDLIMRGACDTSSAITNLAATFELSAIRNAEDLFQPLNVKVSGGLSEVLSAGVALVTFQHGDYSQASEQIAALPTSVQTRELQLLRANAMLFDERHEDAIVLFSALTTEQPNWSAAFHNLGVALFSKAQKQDIFAMSGQDYLDSAIRLAAEQGETDIELSARANYSNLQRHTNSNFDKAKTACQRAEALNGQSVLTRYCWIYYYMAIRGRPGTSATQISAKMTEYLGIPQIDDPPRLQVLRGAWYQDQHAYQRFLEQMQFHACLSQDRKFLADVVR
ncbi:hypothetical protein [Candidatus Amarolinea aalborgensis]|uniref:hypothetical protein n=1 Tax=Candidatus Amarolinea aalborgensis TaxID=2249329 RepID=UPI003BFA1095